MFQLEITNDDGGSEEGAICVLLGFSSRAHHHGPHHHSPLFIGRNNKKTLKIIIVITTPKVRLADDGQNRARKRGRHIHLFVTKLLIKAETPRSFASPPPPKVNLRRWVVSLLPNEQQLSHLSIRETRSSWPPKQQPIVTFVRNGPFWTTSQADRPGENGHSFTLFFVSSALPFIG